MKYFRIYIETTEMTQIRVRSATALLLLLFWLCWISWNWVNFSRGFFFFFWNSLSTYLTGMLWGCINCLCKTSKYKRKMKIQTIHLNTCIYHQKKLPRRFSMFNNNWIKPYNKNTKLIFFFKAKEIENCCIFYL